MAGKLLGAIDWGYTRDEEGYKDYWLHWLIRTMFPTEGPMTVERTPGLPVVGAPWQINNDFDPNVYCTPEQTIRPVITNEPGNYWVVEQKFKHPKPGSEGGDDSQRCRDQQFQSPLLEPPKYRGRSKQIGKEVTEGIRGLVQLNANGEETVITAPIWGPLTTTSWEPIKGKNVEFNTANHTIEITMNLPMLPLQNFAPMLNHVNDKSLWGLPKRSVIFADAEWERAVYGTCSFYYPVHYTFEVNFDTHDRLILNEGQLCLRGHCAAHGVPELNPLAADPDVPGKLIWQNPKNYDVYKDRFGENAKCLLDQYGRPLKEGDKPYYLKVERLKEANLTSLGIPLSF